MQEVTRTRMKMVQAMLPLIGRRPRVIDWADQLNPRMLRLDFSGVLGDCHLLSYTNWDSTPARVEIQLSEYGLAEGRVWSVRDFWTEKTMIVEDNRLEIMVPPHGTALLAVR